MVLQACGASVSQNNSYAIMTSYSTSTDADPCTYTICKSTYVTAGPTLSNAHTKSIPSSLVENMAYMHNLVAA